MKKEATYLLVCVLLIFTLNSCSKVEGSSIDITISSNNRGIIYTAEDVKYEDIFGILSVDSKLVLLSENKLHIENNSILSEIYVPHNDMSIIALARQGSDIIVVESDNNGTWITVINLSGDIVKERELLYKDLMVFALASDSQGVIYCVNGNNIDCFRNGAKTTIKVDGSILGIAGNGDKVYLLLYELSSIFITEIDINNKALIGKTKLPSNNMNLILYDGDSDFNVYLKSDDLIYGIDLNSNSMMPIVGLLDSGINSNRLLNWISKDKSFYCLFYDTNGKIRVSALTDMPNTPEREIITLALFNGNYSAAFYEQIIEFNRDNAEYQIEVVKYIDSADGYYTNGYTGNTQYNKFLLDITTGKIPDIIDVSVIPKETLFKKDLFIDLYPFMDSDPEISRGDFYSNIMNALERNGSLYHTLSAFRIFTAVADQNVVGDMLGWSITTAQELALKNDKKILYYDRDSFLSFFCAQYANNFIDYEKGVCSFDSLEFVKLLEMVKELPPWNEVNFYSGTGHQDYLCVMISVDTMDILSGDKNNNIERYFDEYVFKGLPCDNGVGNWIFGDGVQLAITSSSDKKEGAWQFVRTMFLPEYQSSFVRRNLVSNKNTLDTYVAEALNRNKENGNEVLNQYINTRYERVLNELVNNNTSRMYYIDSALYNIICEEMKIYFNGDKTAKETASIIQGRASLYIGEQM